MINHEYRRRTAEGIEYFDYSGILDTLCGMIIRNRECGHEQADRALINLAASHYKNSHNIKIIRLNQKHTNNVIAYEEPLGQPADGVFCSIANHILTVKTADCFPVFLYDRNTAALIHAGWRGVLNGILTEYFYSVRPDLANLKALIGPGIRECCFEVSPEVMILFDKQYRVFNGDKVFIDVKSLILDELKKYGVKYIIDNGDCTACNSDLFYSYRREGSKVKQMISFISAGG